MASTAPRAASVLTHSPTLHTKPQPAGSTQTLAKATATADRAGRHPGTGQDPTRESGEVQRRDHHDLPTTLGASASSPGSLTGDTPAEHRFTFTVDEAARTALEDEIFGKRVLITDHDDWPAPEVVAGYRSQSEAEFSFRQMKDTRVVSFSPMHHWTEHNIRVHLFTCVLALQLAHLMRRQARHAGLRYCRCRELLGPPRRHPGESVLIYPPPAADPRPGACSPRPPPTQNKLTAIFELDRFAPHT